MATHSHKHTTYREALELARQLSVRDQRRLSAELAKLSGVKLVKPSQDPKVIGSARLLAEEIRKTIQAATEHQSLDEDLRKRRKI